MYARLPTAEELSGSGYTLEDFEGEECIVWPENWQAVSLFSQVQTQWNVGMGGPTGLQYLVLFNLIGRLKLSDEDHDLLFEDIQTLEHAALQEMSKKT